MTNSKKEVQSSRRLDYSESVKVEMTREGMVKKILQKFARYFLYFAVAFSYHLIYPVEQSCEVYMTFSIL